MTDEKDALIAAVAVQLRERDALRAKTDAMMSEANAALRAAIQEATDGGARLREIAAETGLTTARIAQLRDGVRTQLKS